MSDITYPLKAKPADCNIKNNKPQNSVLLKSQFRKRVLKGGVFFVMHVTKIIMQFDRSGKIDWLNVIKLRLVIFTILINQDYTSLSAAISFACKPISLPMIYFIANLEKLSSFWA